MLAGTTPTAFGDAERHIIGAGFVTLLILGEGANLLPGFGRRPLRTQALVWTTLILGNLAALLRVGPVLLPGVLPSAWLLSSAGLFGLLAILVFAINVGSSAGRTDPLVSTSSFAPFSRR